MIIVVAVVVAEIVEQMAVEAIQVAAIVLTVAAAVAVAAKHQAAQYSQTSGQSVCSPHILARGRESRVRRGQFRRSFHTRPSLIHAAGVGTVIRQRVVAPLAEQGRGAERRGEEGGRGGKGVMEKVKKEEEWWGRKSIKGREGEVVVRHGRQGEQYGGNGRSKRSVWERKGLAEVGKVNGYSTFTLSWQLSPSHFPVRCILLVGTYVSHAPC